MPRHRGQRGGNNSHRTSVGSRKQRILRGLDFGSTLTEGAWISLQSIDSVARRLHIAAEYTVAQWFHTMAEVCRTEYSRWGAPEKTVFYHRLDRLLDELSRIERCGGDGAREAAIGSFVGLQLPPCLATALATT